jgi:hypothetical protein
MEEFLPKSAYEVIRDFTFDNGQTLYRSHIERLATVAEACWPTREPGQPRLQHGFVFSDWADAGEYRSSVLIHRQTGVIRDYPSYFAVTGLMTELFVPAYERALARLMKGDDPADVAWRVGAMLRAIHPFTRGTMPLSMIAENHVRVRWGLDPTTELRPKEEFEKFRYGEFQALIRNKPRRP